MIPPQTLRVLFCSPLEGCVDARLDGSRPLSCRAHGERRREALWRRGVVRPNLELGLKQFSFHRTMQVLRNDDFCAFSSPSAFPPCCVPLCLSTSGKAVDLWNIPSSSSPLVWQYGVSCRGAHRARRTRPDGPPCDGTRRGTRRSHSTIPFDAVPTPVSSFRLLPRAYRYEMLIGSD